MSVPYPPDEAPRHMAPRRRRRWPVVLAGAMLLAGAAGGALAAWTGAGMDGPDGTTRTDGDLPAAMRSPAPATIGPSTTAPPADRPSTTAPPAADPPATDRPAATTTVAPTPAGAGTGALCIGDSVMLGASSRYFGTLTLCGTVDADESRQMSDGPGVVRRLAPYPDTVVVHLGTNGEVDRSDVDETLRLLDGVPTVVLTTVQLNGRRSWQDQVNAEIRAAAVRWPNVRLADWEAESTGHPEYFRDDGIHLSEAGAQAYAEVVAGAR